MGRATIIGGLACAAALAAAGPAAASFRGAGVWHFNEGMGTTAHDRSGQGNTGTLEGGATWTAGRFRSAVSFDGSDAAVAVPRRASLEPSSVSVSAWVESSASPGTFKYIVAKGANGCLASSYGLYTGANGGVQFYASSNQGMSWSISPDAGPKVWDGKWHSVVGTFNGSVVRLYVDGRQVGSGTADTQPIAYGLPSSNDLQIGDYPGCSGLDFSGKIDEVRIFDRALDPFEIGLGYQLSRSEPSVAWGDLIR